MQSARYVLAIIMIKCLLWRLNEHIEIKMKNPMQNKLSFFRNQKGFSLVEMAVVLVILGLVLATLFAPLAAQRDIKNITGTQASLNQIKEAINGFAILNGRLPCPAKVMADPSNASYGLEDSALCGQEGLLPWKTLGVPETDEWGTHRTLSTDAWIGFWKYRADSNYDSTTALFSTNMMASVPAFADNLIVKDTTGNDLTPSAAGTEKPIAIVYSTGKDLLANGQNSGAVDSIYESDANSAAFDDMLIWITRPVLVNKLVSAGKLPQ